MDQSESALARQVNSGVVCAIDLGGTHLRAALVDQDGNISLRYKQKTPLANDPEIIVQAMVGAVREFQEQTSDTQIGAISVVAPGTINAEEGMIVTAPNVSSLDEFKLCDALSSELGLPALLENDANAAAVGELWMGAGRGSRTIVCLTLGTGVGGGIILGGKLWRGVDGAAAEVGHMCVEPFGGTACPCGSHGCLEVYASATAIVRLTREALPRHPASSLHVEQLTSEEIYRAGKNGDRLALEVFHRMGIYLGIGIANLINILNPEMVVIGGGVANGWDLFERDMYDQVAERAFPMLANRVKILRAKCGDDAGLLGAARLAFDY